MTLDWFWVWMYIECDGGVVFYFQVEISHVSALFKIVFFIMNFIHVSWYELKLRQFCAIKRHFRVRIRCFNQLTRFQLLFRNGFKLLLLSLLLLLLLYEYNRIQFTLNLRMRMLTSQPFRTFISLPITLDIWALELIIVKYLRWSSEIRITMGINARLPVVFWFWFDVKAEACFVIVQVENTWVHYFLNLFETVFETEVGRDAVLVVNWCALSLRFWYGDLLFLDWF